VPFYRSFLLKEQHGFIVEKLFLSNILTCIAVCFIDSFMDAASRAGQANYLLTNWLFDKKVSQAKLARLLKVTQPTVYRWSTGETRPEAHLRIAIQYLSDNKIPQESWMYEHEMELAYKYRKKTDRERALRR
jgi:hypothetical protein